MWIGGCYSRYAPGIPRNSLRQVGGKVCLPTVIPHLSMRRSIGTNPLHWPPPLPPRSLLLLGQVWAKTEVCWLMTPGHEHGGSRVRTKRFPSEWIFCWSKMTKLLKSPEWTLEHHKSHYLFRSLGNKKEVTERGERRPSQPGRNLHDSQVMTKSRTQKPSECFSERQLNGYRSLQRRLEYDPRASVAKERLKSKIWENRKWRHPKTKLTVDSWANKWLKFDV